LKQVVVPVGSVLAIISDIALGYPDPPTPVQVTHGLPGEACPLAL
jgi:hypothetical protein